MNQNDTDTDDETSEEQGVIETEEEGRIIVNESLQEDE